MLKVVREWPKSNEFLKKYDKSYPPSGHGLFEYPFDGSGRRHGRSGSSALDLLRELGSVIRIRKS